MSVTADKKCSFGAPYFIWGGFRNILLEHIVRSLAFCFHSCSRCSTPDKQTTMTSSSETWKSQKMVQLLAHLLGRNQTSCIKVFAGLAAWLLASWSQVWSCAFKPIFAKAVKIFPQSHSLRFNCLGRSDDFIFVQQGSLSSSLFKIQQRFVQGLFKGDCCVSLSGRHVFQLKQY